MYNLKNTKTDKIHILKSENSTYCRDNADNFISNSITLNTDNIYHALSIATCKHCKRLVKLYYRYAY